MTDEQILDLYLKDDVFYKSFSDKEDLDDYRESMKNTLGFQIYLSSFRLNEAVNKVKSEIAKLPLLKRIYASLLFKKLLRTNLNKK